MTDVVAAGLWDAPLGGLPWFVLLAALWLALLIDHGWGEPPARVHPVVWMGRLLDGFTPWVAPLVVQALRPWQAWMRGMLAWSLGASLVVVLACAWQWLALSLPAYWALPMVALALKPLLAWRMLREEVQAVEDALSRSLDEGRQRLAWLVSRDVNQLDASGVRESAVETLAENLNDSVIAPLFWFLVAGLPGAALYRWANTADAMWGYPGERNGRDWNWSGQWAARADDVLSWLPARLTGFILLCFGGVWRWRDWWVESRRTPSPNSGWPMAAMALALDVTLSKPSVYRLNASAPAPAATTTSQAIALAQRVVWAVPVTVSVLFVVYTWDTFL